MTMKEAAFVIKTRTVKRSSGRLLNELLRNERLDAEILGRLERSRFEAIARFAMQNVDYYRESLRSAGLKERDLQDPESWDSIPVLERSDVKENVSSFWSAEATKSSVREALTGGSTGEPLQTGNDARVPLLALSWRMYSWWGIAPWDNIARVGRWHQSRRGLLVNATTWWPTKQVFLQAAMLDEEHLARFLTQIRVTKPALIEGYVGALQEIANYVSGSAEPFYPPVAIGSTSAPLTGPARRRLEAVLGAPVYDQYRSSEVPWMAGECKEQNGLHVFSDMRRIEVLDSENQSLPPGQVGDLVVTDLTNRVFPIIRYKLGDRGSLRPGQCPCGVTLPLMDPPAGRIADVIRFPRGGAIAGGLVSLFSSEPAAVRLFQVHQQSDYSVVLRVVLGTGPGAREAVESVAESLRTRVSHRMPVRVEYVDSLPYTGGKIQYIISDVPDDRV